MRLCRRGVYEGSFLAPLTLRRKIGQDHDVKFVVYDVQSAGGDTGALSDEERVGCVKIEGSVALIAFPVLLLTID